MFWTLVVLASFDTFRELKQELASSNMKDEFHRIAEVGFIAVEFVTRLYFVKMVTFHQKSILGVLECLRELQAWKYQLDIHKVPFLYTSWLLNVVYFFLRHKE